MAKTRKMTIKAPDTRLKQDFKAPPALKPQGKVTLYHLGAEDFAVMAKLFGEDPEVAAFARWGKTWWGAKIQEIYMRCGREDTLAHEILHFQKGHFHD